jgi:hypothetical protein
LHKLRSQRFYYGPITRSCVYRQMAKG